MTDKEPLGEGLLLTDEQIKRYGYGWMQNYDYEIKALLLAQVAKLLSLGYVKLPAPGSKEWEELSGNIAKLAHHWHCPSEDWERPLHWTGPKVIDYYELADSILSLLAKGGTK